MKNQSQQIRKLEQKVKKLTSENRFLAIEAEQVLQQRIVGEKLDNEDSKQGIINTAIENIVTCNRFLFAAYFRVNDDQLVVESLYGLSNKLSLRSDTFSFGLDLKEQIASQDGYFDLSTDKNRLIPFLSEGEELYDGYLLPVYFDEQIDGIVFVANNDDQTSIYQNHLNTINILVDLLEKALSRYYFVHSLEKKIAQQTGELLQELEKKQVLEKKLTRERDLFITGPVVIFRWRNAPGWPVEYVSKNVKKVFGYSVDDFVSGRICYSDLIHHQDIERVASELTIAFDSSDTHFEHDPYRIIRKDGDTILLDDYTLIQRIEDGEATHFLGYVTDITHRVNTDRELTRIRKEQSIILNNIPVGVSFVRDQKFIWSNKMVTTLTGYSNKELAGINLSKHLWSQRDSRKINIEVSKQIRRGKKYQGEWLMRRKDGSKAIALLKAIAINPSNLSQGVIWVVDDISAQKMIEKNLKESEKKFSTVFQKSPSALSLTRVEDGKLIEINKGFTRIFGYSEDKAQGKTSLELNIWLSKDERNKVMMELLQKGQLDEKETQYRTKSGKVIDCKISATLVKINNEVVILAEIIDITKQKKIETEHLEQFNQLTTLMETIPDAVFLKDEEGRWLLTNHVARQLFQLEDFSWQGKTDKEMAIERPSFFDVHETCAVSDEVAWQQKELSIGIENIPAEDGSTHIFEVRKMPRMDSYGNRKALVTIGRDITERKKAEDEKEKLKLELYQAHKLEAIGVLAGGIAHDFNNILSAILGNIQLASFRVKKDTITTSLLSNAQKATKRAAKLTQQLLTFSKGGDPIKETTTLPEIIIESTDFVLSGSQVSCDYVFQDDLWMVNVDGGQISQVIQNIILNAKQAMPEGGRINIRCDNVEDVAAEISLGLHDGNYVRVTIQDTGIGITLEITDKIFDPYFTTKQEGSGLGLTICHSIIKKHGGHITTKSIPGEGTIFTIYLPAEHSVSTSVAKQKKTKPVAKAAKIMVMDDEEMIRDLTKSQLSALGHEAVLVVDGEQAIKTYQEMQDSGTPFDLVIMDLTIPGGTGGREAAQQLLQLDPEAKIIVASGYSNDPVMANYHEYGFCNAIAKPFDLDALSNCIDSALN